MENVGALALLLAFCISLYAIISSVVGRLKGKPFLTLSGERAVLAVWALVSTAAGILVSKSGVTGSADKALVRQFTHYPKALGMSAAVIAALALLPGMPIIPFLGLAGGVGYMAFTSSKRSAARRRRSRCSISVRSPVRDASRNARPASRR